jgi:hypothetical protein
MLKCNGFNPTYLLSETPAANPQDLESMRFYLVPIGLLGMLRTGANPLQYLTNRAAFLGDFDLATMITVLSSHKLEDNRKKSEVRTTVQVATFPRNTRQNSPEYSSSVQGWNGVF